jgi:GPI ethanolamine phosphate transferase 3 subunit O
MEKGEVFTPLSDITAARKPAAPEKKQPTQASKETADRSYAAKIDDQKAKRIGQVHFKATHGLVVAYFTLFL